MKNMLMLEISLGFHFFKSSFPSCVNWPHYFKDSHRSTFPPTHPWAFFFSVLFIFFTILYWFCQTLTWICHGCTCAPILNPPPTSLPIPSLWVIPVHQPEHPVSCIEPGLAIHFTYDTLHISMPFSHIIPPAPSPSVQKTVLYICVSFAVSHTGLSLPSF